MGTTEMTGQSKEFGIFKSVTEYAANFQSNMTDLANALYKKEKKKKNMVEYRVENPLPDQFSCYNWVV